MKSKLSLMLVIIFSAGADEAITLGPHEIHVTSTIDPISSDLIVYSQTFDPRIWYNGASIYSGGNRWLCDDFVLDDDYYVSEVYVWMIWTGEQGSMMNFVISEDDALDSDPNTNTDVWVESVPCTNTFTGISNWGYDIYETYCVINEDVYPELYTEKHYYFEAQGDVNDNCFIIFCDNYVGDYCWYNDGTEVWTRSDTVFGLPLDMFFDFYGEPVSALESETWGSIKTLF